MNPSPCQCMSWTTRTSHGQRSYTPPPTLTPLRHQSSQQRMARALAWLMFRENQARQRHPTNPSSLLMFPENRARQRHPTNLSSPKDRDRQRHPTNLSSLFPANANVKMRQRGQRRWRRFQSPAQEKSLPEWIISWTVAMGNLQKRGLDDGIPDQLPRSFRQNPRERKMVCPISRWLVWNFLPSKTSTRWTTPQLFLKFSAGCSLAAQLDKRNAAATIRNQYHQRLQPRFEDKTVELSKQTVQFRVYTPNEQHDMSSSREYTWQPLKDEEADIWRKILDEQPTGFENGEQRPLHMLESARSLDFVGDGSQSEVCVISYDDFLQLLPRRIGEIFANRSFLLYNCPSEGDSPSEHPRKDFEECIKRIRSGKALVHIQDGYVEQEADKGIAIDMLEKLIPNEHFRNGKPRGNTLQNLIPDHPAIIVPRLDQWAIHLRAVTHTADLPGLPRDDLPTEHLQWAIFGNDGVYTAEHVDAAGFTAVKVLNQTG
ncbi:hypothetical protein C8F01DRAFT_351328 [Mycena amicta]|nr:hypothetical protein C8F01DRAFT_351328 [Mycena amicta]